MTRAEFDLLPSDRQHECPDCGYSDTTPYPNCGCPEVRKTHFSFTLHINMWHHDCEDAKSRHEERISLSA